MKLRLLLFAFTFFLSETFYSQCILVSTVSDVTLQCSNVIVGGTLNRTGVAFNPNQNLYYSVNAGASAYPIETFPVTGGAAISTNAQAVDYRGLWWNSTANTLEGNTFNSVGIYSHGLTPITFYASASSTYLTPGTMPFNQSQGHADITNNLVLYFNAGNIYKYNKTSGILVATIAITGLPVALANINNYGIAYTGITGSEVAIYNYVNRCIYFINYTSGAYVSTCTLPATAPNPATFRTGFANNRFFLYESTLDRWYGYPVLSGVGGPTITIAASTTSICSGSSVSLTASGANNYLWSTAATTASVQVSPASSSIYTVSGTNAAGCVGSSTISILVNPGTSVSPVASPSVICTGSSATLTASGSVSYTWSPVASNSTSLNVNPTSTATYTVLGTSAFGCTSTAVITLTVDPNVPVISIANTANSGGICPTKTVMLTASGAATYTWTGGSPTVTNGVAFSPNTAADYTVTGANSCGTTAAVTSVSVHPFPTINASASSSSICSGTSVTLTATGNSTNYAWSGHTSAISNGSGFSPVLTATYTVIGTSALSCTALATVPVTVVTTPVIPPIANPALICIGGSSTLTAQGATNYTWTSLTQTVFTSSLVATPSAPGISTYTITKSNSNCVDTKIITVVTNALPTIFAIVTPTLVCALSPATLAVGGGQTYTWTSSTSNVTFGGPSPVVYPVAPTVYSVAASDGTCINTTMVSLAVDPNPTINIAATSTAICSGQSVTLTGSGGNNYTVTSSNGGNFNTFSVTQSPTVTVAYTFTGDNSFGCSASAMQVIIVNANPTVNITSNKTLVCSGGPSTLTANGANNYTWTSNNALTHTTVVNPTNTVSGPVVYTVMGSYTTGCTSSKTIAVNVFVPVLTVSGATNTCVGGLLSLSAGGGNPGTYVWNTGSSTSNFQTLTTTLSAAAVFTVSATSTSITSVCPATKTINVDVNATPIITAVAQRTTICIRESVDIYGTGGISYAWNTSATTGTITVAPTIQTNYTVTGTDANGCVGTGTVQIKVSNCVGISELSNLNTHLIVYPNPNNGEFTVQSSEAVTLNLSNELGQVIRVINLSGSTNYEVSITELSKGIYFLSGKNDAGRINQKIIVTK